MTYTGHKDIHINGKGLADHLRPVIEEEARFYKWPIQSSIGRWLRDAAYEELSK